MSAPAPAPTAPPARAPIAVLLYSFVPSGLVAHPASSTSRTAREAPRIRFPTFFFISSLPFPCGEISMRFARAARAFRSPHLITGPPGVFHPRADPCPPSEAFSSAQHRLHTLSCDRLSGTGGGRSSSHLSMILPPLRFRKLQGKEPA